MSYLFDTYPRAINFVIRSFIQQFGISVDIFKPKLHFNGQHGRLDEHTEFEELPIFSGRVLIPSHYRLKVGNSLNLNDLLYSASGDLFLFVETDVKFPLGSKIVSNTAIGSINSYLIDDEFEVGDDEVLLFRKYRIVPFDSLLVPTQSEVFDSIPNEDGQDLDLLSSDEDISQSFIYAPLERKDT